MRTIVQINKIIQRYKNLKKIDKTVSPKSTVEKRMNKRGI